MFLVELCPSACDMSDFGTSVRDVHRCWGLNRASSLGILNRSACFGHFFVHHIEQGRDTRGHLSVEAGIHIEVSPTHHQAQRYPCSKAAVTHEIGSQSRLECLLHNIITSRRAATPSSPHTSIRHCPPHSSSSYLRGTVSCHVTPQDRGPRPCAQTALPLCSRTSAWAPFVVRAVRPRRVTPHIRLRFLARPDIVADASARPTASRDTVFSPRKGCADFGR